MNEVNWILTLLIFLSRIFDVSLGTLRIIFIGKGRRVLAPLLGFVEVFIWIVVVSQIIQNVSNLVGYLAYAGGFAAGNFVGLWIENRLALGTMMVRVIVAIEPEALVNVLKEAGHGVTSFPAEGASGPVRVIYTVVQRKELADVIRLIQVNHPHAFYTVEEVRQVSEGVFHRPQSHSLFRFIGLKGKK
jgi:uncharacterized protein YebE (UPF0316 family)